MGSWGGGGAVLPRMEGDICLPVKGWKCVLGGTSVPVKCADLQLCVCVSLRLSSLSADTLN